MLHTFTACGLQRECPSQLLSCQEPQPSPLKCTCQSILPAARRLQTCSPASSHCQCSTSVRRVARAAPSLRPKLSRPRALECRSSAACFAPASAWLGDATVSICCAINWCVRTGNTRGVMAWSRCKRNSRPCLLVIGRDEGEYGLAHTNQIEAWRAAASLMTEQ